jgi:N-acetylglucosaminyldiphosphoundecaprenol N-acetyl-beta-D-mannosaminyltransferase
LRADRVRVLGVPIDPITTEQLHALVEQHLVTKAPLHIATVNAEFVMQAQHDREFREVLSRVDAATADGAGILWALRRQRIHLPTRVGGSDLIWSISEICAARHARLFLLGGVEGRADSAALRLKERYPDLCIAGADGGDPSPAEEGAIVDLIRRSKADVLFVAFGAPQQEIWIARNLPSTGAVVALGVGGSFDYLAGAARRAPVWIQVHGLEWLWRLVRQPWRWRRMLALPRFAWLVWRERPAVTERTEP